MLLESTRGAGTYTNTAAQACVMAAGVSVPQTPPPAISFRPFDPTSASISVVLASSSILRARLTKRCCTRLRRPTAKCSLRTNSHFSYPTIPSTTSSPLLPILCLSVLGMFDG
ncbi:hypothetical protein PENSPDRAFT_230074 [Peniophora sp. CONT]|nr:hypothetical protein PENSPDRAFT_230074 [Peniophora sp. CONT]